MVTEIVVSGRKRLKRRTTLEEMAFLAKTSEEEVCKILEILGVSAEKVQLGKMTDYLGVLARVKQIARVWRADVTAVTPDADENLLSILGRGSVAGWRQAEFRYFRVREGRGRGRVPRVVCPKCYAILPVEKDSAESCECGTEIVRDGLLLYWLPPAEIKE